MCKICPKKRDGGRQLSENRALISCGMRDFRIYYYLSQVVRHGIPVNHRSMEIRDQTMRRVNTSSPGKPGHCIDSV